MKAINILYALALFFAPNIVFSNTSPEWISGKRITKNGNTLDVIGEGGGPSYDIAYREAVERATALAASNINDVLKIQSLSIRTQNNVAYHQEIATDKIVTGLTCDSQKEFLEKIDGSITVWVLCRFDFTKAKVVPMGNANNIKSKIEDINNAIEIDDQAVKSSGPNGHNVNVPVAKMTIGESWQLNLTTVPQCDDLLIRGVKPRTFKCDEVPTVLIIEKSDEELIIRAVGYLPKRIDLTKPNVSNRKRTIEIMEVYLDKM